MPECGPAFVTLIFVPSGRTLGSAATVPGWVGNPDFVMPGPVYAVAMNGVRARVDCACRAGSSAATVASLHSSKRGTN